MSRVLLGALGQSVCWDANGNEVDCSDPSAVSSTVLTSQQQAAIQAGSGEGAGSPTICWDANGNEVDCSSPGAVDSTTLTAKQQAAIQAGSGQGTPSAPGNIVKAATAVTAAARPSPVVSVPLSSSSSGSVGMFLTGSTLVSGIPNIALIGGVMIGAVLLLGGGKKRRR